MNAHNCIPSRGARGHWFDADSGWCIHGCGVRSDGRVVHLLPRRTLADRPTAPARPAAHRTLADVIDITQPRRGFDT